MNPTNSEQRATPRIGQFQRTGVARPPQPEIGSATPQPWEKRYNDTSRLRMHTAYWVVIVVSVWLLVVISVVVLCGLRWLHISDAVLITLLGTTTVNIIGLPFVLLQGLYHKPTKSKK